MLIFVKDAILRSADQTRAGPETIYVAIPTSAPESFWTSPFALTLLGAVLAIGGGIVGHLLQEWLKRRQRRRELLWRLINDVEATLVYLRNALEQVRVGGRAGDVSITGLHQSNAFFQRNHDELQVLEYPALSRLVPALYVGVAALVQTMENRLLSVFREHRPWR